MLKLGMLSLALLISAQAYATPKGIGQLDAELMKVATTAKQVDKIKAYLNAEGVAWKTAVYHHDASRIPEAVRNLAEALFPGTEVHDYESEVYADLGRVFEIELKTKEGQEIEISAKADGTLVYVEREIAYANVPAPVKATVEARVKGGEVLEAEHKKGPALDHYAVKLKKDGKINYLRVAPDGALITHGLRFPAQIEVLLP